MAVEPRRVGYYSASCDIRRFHGAGGRKECFFGGYQAYTEQGRRTVTIGVGDPGKVVIIAEHTRTGKAHEHGSLLSQTPAMGIVNHLGRDWSVWTDRLIWRRFITEENEQDLRYTGLLDACIGALWRISGSHRERMDCRTGYYLGSHSPVTNVVTTHLVAKPPSFISQH